MTNKREISITLDQAREWYFGDNDTLREIALKAYSKPELEKEINILFSMDNSVLRIQAINLEYSKIIALTKLANIAKFFNKEWFKTVYNTGYFIGKKAANKNTELPYDLSIMVHNTVKYPGIVYFKNKEDIFKAAKILGPELSLL